MFHILPLRNDALEEFEKLFCDYYKELDCEDDCNHLLKEYIIPDLIAGLIKIDVLRSDGVLSGFVIYQIDDITNDWNFKEGWADIREIYVVPSLRRSGAGLLLLYTAEMKLREAGATQSYALPSEDSVPFFEACGYKATDEHNDDLDCKVYIKTNINNTCGKHSV